MLVDTYVVFLSYHLCLVLSECISSIIELNHSMSIMFAYIVVLVVCFTGLMLQKTHTSVRARL